MAITNFIPEIWASTLQTSLKKALVFGGPSVINRNYEGEIADAGDTVRITSISRPTVADYVKNSTSISPETLTDAQRTLVVDQCKYFAFEIDDVDRRQAKNGGALMSEAANEAAYALADTTDQYIAGLYTQGANQTTTTQVNDAAKAVTALLTLKASLDTSNVPTAGRYVIVPPWFHNLLLTSDLFVRVDASGSSEALRQGLVGRAFGFDVMMSNNCVNVTGDDWIVQAGVPSAITFADQISKVEAYRPPDSFSDALKGLHLYGAKVVRPTAIASIIASIT